MTGKERWPFDCTSFLIRILKLFLTVWNFVLFFYFIHTSLLIRSYLPIVHQIFCKQSDCDLMMGQVSSMMAENISPVSKKIMKRKLKQWWSTIINNNKNNHFLPQLIEHIKRPWHCLAWDKQKNVAVNNIPSLPC